MTRSIRFCQPLVGATLLAAVMALSACSSSDQEPAPASAPAAAATPQSSTPAGSAVAAAPVANFSAYTAAIPATPVNAQCALDAINATPAANAAPLAAGSNVAFSGWAGNGKGQAAHGFQLVLKGARSYSAPIATNVARQDVVNAFSSDGMANSGFKLHASLVGVAAGSYTLYLADPADPSNACATNRTVVVQ
jgi:hypothetical protein